MEFDWGPAPWSCAIRLLRSFAVAMSLAVAFLGSYDVAVAAPGDGTVVIRVVDISGRPVDARVLIVGTSQGQSLQGLTRGGIARFSLSAGRYWVTVEATGYERVRQGIEIDDRVVREVLFHLAELKEIGRVHSRGDSSVTVSSPISASRRISHDLAEALNSVAGVSAIGNDSSLGIHVSLQGQDESLTQYTFGNAPISANAAALAVNTDLVQTVQVDESRNLVRFIGLGPTPTATTRLRGRAGSYGSAFESASFQDTFGQIGVAVLHTLRAEESPLNGSVYRDTSGRGYRHVGALHTVGDYFSMGGPVGGWAGSALTASSRNRASPLSTYLTGNTPAGTGPGEFEDRWARNIALSLNGALGSNSVALTYARFDTGAHDTQQQRLVDGSTFAFNLRQRANVETYSASLQRALTPGATAEAAVQVFNQSSAASLSTLETVAADRVYDTQVELRSADHTAWSIAYKGGRVSRRSHGAIAARITRRVGREVMVTAMVSDGTIGQEGNDARRARGWIEPYAADFDCADGTIVTEGPGDSAATPHESRLFGLAAFEKHSINGSVAAWQTRTHGQLITGALVPLRPSDPSLPTVYFSRLVDEASSSLRCGTGRSEYSVFARRDIAGQSTTARGLSVTLSSDQSATHAELSLDLVSARLDTLDSRLIAPQSLYLPGAQLPGVPFMRGTLALDRLLAPNLEAVASFHYESSNNRYNLPPFFVTSIGVARRLSPVSSLSVVAGNVFNTNAGVFVSPHYARPLHTKSGSLISGVAAPLPPFHIALQFDLSLGK